MHCLVIDRQDLIALEQLPSKWRAILYIIHQDHFSCAALAGIQGGGVSSPMSHRSSRGSEASLTAAVAGPRLLWPSRVHLDPDPGRHPFHRVDRHDSRPVHGSHAHDDTSSMAATWGVDGCASAAAADSRSERHCLAAHENRSPSCYIGGVPPQLWCTNPTNALLRKSTSAYSIKNENALDSRNQLAEISSKMQ